MGKIEDLTFFELELFLEASHVRSLRELARRLRLKPAHLSKALKRLELKLETELFSRSANGIKMTPEGARLLPMVEEICELGQKLFGEKGSAAKKARERRATGFASVNFLQLYVAVPAVGHLMADYPRLRFRLLEMLPDELIMHGLGGAFDMALHLGALEWPRNWASRRVGALRFGLFARAGHPLPAEPREVEILDYPFVIPTYWSEGRFVPGGDQCPLPVAARKWSHEAGTALVAVQTLPWCDSLSFVPEPVARPLVDQGVLRQILVKEWSTVERDLFLTVHTMRVTQPLLQAAIKVIRKVVTR
jgi:DNA-binding transcriptional LysR family regulator